MRKTRSGFATFAALAILALCGGFAVFFLKMFTLGQEKAALEAMGEKALQAAKAGGEIAIYQSAVSGSCANSTVSLPGFEEFTVALSCARTTTAEGSVAVTVDQWVVTACNASTCPAGAPSGSYVERQVKLDVAR